MAAGFRRWSTYRLAALAGMSTNLVFGFMRCAVLLTVFDGAARVAGYDPSAAVTFVWVGQALIDIVLAWGSTQFGERVRSGDIAIDLVRPWDLQLALLADDLGRVGFSLLVRFVPPMLVGAAFFDLRLPGGPVGWAAFAVAVPLAALVGFAMRFLLNLTAFWLLDWRGVFGLYIIASGLLAGLIVPIGLFPRWAEIAVWCTPFPAMLQVPADLLVERGNPLLLLAHQLGWAIVLLWLGRVVLRRAERVLVVQGG
ncbi:MAG TPA: ABC-2 family transporter protein [Polyangiales bacterium]|nr:ABC-2 family transporter protein [Polyangiales bacterium]